VSYLNFVIFFSKSKIEFFAKSKIEN